MPVMVKLYLMMGMDICSISFINSILPISSASPAYIPATQVNSIRKSALSWASRHFTVNPEQPFLLIAFLLWHIGRKIEHEIVSSNVLFDICNVSRNALYYLRVILITRDEFRGTIFAIREPLLRGTSTIWVFIISCVQWDACMTHIWEHTKGSMESIIVLHAVTPFCVSQRACFFHYC